MRVRAPQKASPNVYDLIGISPCWCGVEFSLFIYSNCFNFLIGLVCFFGIPFDIAVFFVKPPMQEERMNIGCNPVLKM